MSARIDPPRRPPSLAHLAFWYTRRLTGKVPDPLRILARRPRLMLATATYEWAISKTSKLPARLGGWPGSACPAWSAARFEWTSPLP